MVNKHGEEADETHARGNQRAAEEVLGRLGKAESLLRRNLPEEAWQQLGEHDQPPSGWPRQKRPHWAWLAGWTLFLLGRSKDAILCLEEGLRLAQALRLRASRRQQAYWEEMIAWLHCFLGVAHCSLGHASQALASYQRCQEAIGQHQIGNAELRLWVYKGLATEYFALAHYQTAIAFFQRALAEGKNCDNQRQLGLAAWGLAATYQQQGDPFRAKTAFLRAVRIFGESEQWQFLAQVRALYGQALINLRTTRRQDASCKRAWTARKKWAMFARAGWRSRISFPSISRRAMSSGLSAWPGKVFHSCGSVEIGGPRGTCSLSSWRPTRPGKTGKRPSRCRGR